MAAAMPPATASSPVFLLLLACSMAGVLGGDQYKNTAVIQLQPQADAGRIWGMVTAQSDFSLSVKDSRPGGLNECTADSCDEWVKLGWDKEVRENGDPIAVGEVVRFRLNATLNVQSKIRIGLCGRQCSAVTSWGIEITAHGVKMGYIAWLSRSGDVNDNAHSVDIQPYNGPVVFDPEPYHTFAVERRSETRMAVWAEVGALRSNEAVLPLSPDRDRLFVSSFVGPYNFLTPTGYNSSVLARKAEPGVLLSPPVRNSRVVGPQWLCVELELASPGAARFVLLSAFDGHLGVLRPLASVHVPASDTVTDPWYVRRVLIPVPEDDYWRLAVSAAGPVRLEHVSTCNLAKQDEVELGALKEPIELPNLQNLTQSLSSTAVLIEKPVSSNTSDPPCQHGGAWDGSGCECLPGFVGYECQLECSRGRVGWLCEATCYNDQGSCRASFVCGRGAVCHCGPGFKGRRCDQGCDEGEYGPGCALRCGACEGGPYCDALTGRCPDGCRPGFTGRSCEQEQLHMVEPPSVTNISFNRLSGSVVLSKDTTAGEGSAALLKIQYRVVAVEPNQGYPLDDERVLPVERAWRTADLQSVQWGRGDPSFRTMTMREGRPISLPQTLHWHIDGLPPLAKVDVRAVLLDGELRAREHEGLPFATVKLARPPAGQGPTAEGERVTPDENPHLSISLTSPWSASVRWTHAPVGAVAIAYECEALLACNDSCAHSAGLAAAGRRSAVVQLKGLLPAARYRVRLVSVGDPEHGLALATSNGWTFSTRTLAPSTVPVNGRVVERGRDWASLRWAEPAHACLLDNGPRAGYHWELLPAEATTTAEVQVQARGNTSEPAVRLDGLRPATGYRLAVFARGVDGWQPRPPRGPLHIDFTTAA